MHTVLQRHAALATGLALLSVFAPHKALAWGHAPALPISQVSGHYEGSMTTHLDNGPYALTPLAADISRENGTLFRVTPRDKSGNVRITLEVTAIHGSTITLSSSLGMKEPMPLVLQNDTQCFAGKADLLVTLCANDGNLSFEILNSVDHSSVLSLVLHHFSPNEAAPVNEQPRSFTLTQAVERARTQSFSSRIEFEHVIQAKARAKAAYLHLLPQITLGTVVNNIVPTFSSVLSAIGDLAPFLLPDHWLQARAAADMSRAEHDTDILMRLSVGAQVEGLYYTYARDLKTRDLTQDTLKRTIGIRNEVKIREDLGQLPVGSTANMDSIINQIQESLTVMGQVLAEDLASISQTLGFYDSNTVTGATIDTETVPIENAAAVDYKTINAAALSRSFELDQMDFLIASAQAGKSAQYYSWLDPYGDPSLGLGPALHSELEVTRSQIRELQIDKQQLQSILSQKVFNAVTDYGQALQGYQTAKDGMTIQNTALIPPSASLAQA